MVGVNVNKNGGFGIWWRVTNTVSKLVLDHAHVCPNIQNDKGVGEVKSRM